MICPNTGVECAALTFAVEARDTQLIKKTAGDVMDMCSISLAHDTIANDVDTGCGYVNTLVANSIIALTTREAVNA